ncbi:anhydro-N-acetylmuramic acid kinase [Paenibacillus sp. FSL H7-0326]|uniref:anhydro-N-acetylmuramic acid kinase n=1 Tax=Paenibacillus sp. FSL H7-0326 TaxID=1921144 RepID=UPI00096CB709|nr:anhydro-N-acetylmuramic acid kinase [Paenibacillus sp. FSL H7-0326]OMC65608.1 anhydro-N-acetylmuramic acid kinase [Paenibacillus sp. FSL H7-0326]
MIRITGFQAESLVIGLMSGTSLDGVDAALVRIKGSGLSTASRLLAYVQLPYEEEFRERIKALCTIEHSNVEDICSMNFLLADQFAAAAHAVCHQAGIAMDEVDFISSHGQTVWHIPKEDAGRSLARSTLQLGDLSVIAARTGRPVVGDFRPADMAAGGQGAPLVPYGDLILFGDPQRGRILQNIGGIGNCTILPAACTADQVTAYDTGPGNMIIDQVVLELSGGKLAYDENGKWAAEGTPDQAWVSEMMQHPYFSLMPPKSTGREQFGAAYAAAFLAGAGERGLSSADIVATATWFTAKSITDSYKRWVFPEYKIDEIIISGGGAHNEVLLSMLSELLPGRTVAKASSFGIDDDAKEALIFALLGNECIHGIPNNVPSATGAGRRVVMGKLALG